jgi:hypothetical protein
VVSLPKIRASSVLGKARNKRTILNENALVRLRSASGEETTLGPESGITNHQSQISAVPLQAEQAQLDTWIDIGRLIVEIGKTL